MSNDGKTFTQIHTGVGDNIAGDKYEYHIEDVNLDRALALSVCIGSWDESVDLDIKMVEAIVGEPYQAWIKGVRNISSLPNPPISHHMGKWEVTQRELLWSNSLRSLYKPDVDRLASAFKQCFSVIDNALDLPASKRGYAEVLGVKSANSQHLRRGLADGLAYCGAKSSEVNNFEHNYCSVVSERIVRELFLDSDWKLWASNVDVLLQFAEAAPDEFLEALERDLDESSQLITRLFEQSEAVGSYGVNYVSSVISCLGVLAWLPEYMTRAVLILGAIHGISAGGKCAVSAKNSLINIFSPMCLNTAALLKQRMAALNLLMEKNPVLGCDISLESYSSYRVTVLGPKPRFLSVYTDEPDKPNGTVCEEYIELTINLIKMAGAHEESLFRIFDKLMVFVANPPCLQLVLDFTISKGSSFTEELKFRAWRGCDKLLKMHSNSNYIKSCLSDTDVESIRMAAKFLEPKTETLQYQNLFSRNPAEFFDVHNWERDEKKARQFRVEAVRNIYQEGGFQSILDFAVCVDNQRLVGMALAEVVQGEHALELKEFFEGGKGSYRELMVSYIEVRARLTNFDFLNFIDFSGWTARAIMEFALVMPVCSRVWLLLVKTECAEALYGYWGEVSISYPGPIEYEGVEYLYLAIDCLLRVGRPLIALYCVMHIMARNNEFEIEIGLEVLWALVDAKVPLPEKDFHQVGVVLDFLLKADGLSRDNKIKLEIAFFSILGALAEEGGLKLEVYNEMAGNPSFFHMLFSVAYKGDASRNEDGGAAINFAKLLASWRVLPGVSDYGFDASVFEDWFNQVVAKCRSTGHAELILRYVGKLLYNAPSDPNGFWIDRRLANIINGKEMGGLREGYNEGVYMSLGAREVDFEAKLELAMVGELNHKSAECEEQGLFRFAASLRKLALQYADSATSILREEYHFIKEFKAIKNKRREGDIDA